MNQQLRLGIIGAGSVVREIYQHLYFRSRYSNRLQLAAVAEPNESARNWFGDLGGLPANRRFADYQQMLAQTELDAVQVNTPDHLHAAPTLAALAAGLDVLLPKPLAATTKDAHAMLTAAKKASRFLAVDFHKRADPRIKEAAARFQSGRYGNFQSAVFYMLDKVLVADPNHSPRFFASPDFAQQNTPVSFLTVHMADALMQLVRTIPVEVRATGYAQKLPSLKPLSVQGYDLVDTEIVFQGGAQAHIITGWAVPNSAWATTVQSGRLLCSDGLIDLNLDMPGLREIHADGMNEVNPLFRNFEADGSVSGYGINNPGQLYEQMLAWRNGTLSSTEHKTAMSPFSLGFHTTLVLEAAERSLASGEKSSTGTTQGRRVNLAKLLAEELGQAAVAEYGFDESAAPLVGS